MINGPPFSRVASPLRPRTLLQEVWEQHKLNSSPEMPPQISDFSPFIFSYPFSPPCPPNKFSRPQSRANDLVNSDTELEV